MCVSISSASKLFLESKRERWVYEKKLVKCGAAALAVMVASFYQGLPASAYFNRGTVSVSCGAGSVSLEAAQETYVSVSVSPAEDSHTPGCGMAECPDTCGEGCLDANGNCVCAGGEYQSYHTDVSVTSSNAAVAVGSYADGTLVIAGISPGSATITVTGNLVEWESGSGSVDVYVTETSVTPEPEPTPTPDPGNSSGNEYGDSSGGNSGNESGNSSGGNSGNGSGNSSGGNSENGSGNSSGGNSENGSGNSSGGNSENGSGNSSGGSSESGSGNNSGNGSGKGSGNGSKSNGGNGSGKESDAGSSSGTGDANGNDGSGNDDSSGTSSEQTEKEKKLLEEMGFFGNGTDGKGGGGSAGAGKNKMTVRVPALDSGKEWTVYSLGNDDGEAGDGEEKEQKEPLKAAAAGTGTLLFLGGILAEFIGYRKRL